MASSATTESADAEAKVEEYTAFMEQVLKPELKEAKQQLHETEYEISEYVQLNAILEQLHQTNEPSQAGIGSQVDLGYQTVYCPASVDQPLKLFVHVGLGFHAELTPPEAIEFVAQRIAFLKENHLQRRQARVNRVQDHIQSSMNILQELERVRQLK